MRENDNKCVCIKMMESQLMLPPVFPVVRLGFCSTIMLLVLLSGTESVKQSMNVPSTVFTILIIIRRFVSGVIVPAEQEQACCIGALSSKQ